MRAPGGSVRAAGCGLVLAVVLASPSPGAPSGAPDEPELLRRNGDLRAQRRHVWGVIADITRNETGGSTAAFEHWYGESEVFATDPALRSPLGMRGFAHPQAVDAPGGGAATHGLQSGDAPVLTYTLYNAAAYRHIRANRLYRRATLEHLRLVAATSAAGAEEPAVPAFPTDAIVIKTAWWPIARNRITALPVWDPDKNPMRPGGNGYVRWPRVVAVDPSRSHRSVPTARVEFLGRSFDDARRVPIDALHRVSVDARMAALVMRDPDARKAMLLALGRPLRAGDSLVLVAANLATREMRDWVWAALWWHDAGTLGPFAADRPDDIRSEWRNYLVQVAFDTDSPRAPDRGPHICFNPWFEGRFPDGGQGGGMVSNCMACHQRASYPPVPFLPVTRGAADLARDAAYGPGRLRTSFLWSIALHAGP